MAKIGSRIQETRLRKGLALDRIADDTNISLRFLSKIENDDFTGFPGEPYVVGFIRNYAEYLGLDPDLMIRLYRAKDDEILPSMAEVAATQEASPEPETPAKPEPEKPRKGRKPKAPPAEPADSKPRSRSPARAKKAPTHTLEVRLAPASPPPEAPKKKITFSTIMLSILAVAIVVVAGLWIVAGGIAKLSKQEDGGKTPSEYRVEGGSFEMRLYIDDSLLVPLGNDVYKIRLAAIGETVDLETPFGLFKLALGETAPIDPGKDGTADASIIIGDFEKNRPASGALVKVEFSVLEPSDSTGSEITIPETANAAAAGGATISNPPKTDAVIIKSTRGPYPFVVQVSFRGSCLFRYEADRKEWVEKYFSKGESITLNVTNALTVWTSNAQAVKMSFQASGGKTADLELGQPGEIAVKRISWSQSGGSWALIASNLD
ncbi:MAG: helix-turn-helix domain-containing protein [Rectinemataceae bacterium]|nr:helix-turn-helix domain-containing protein [Rectinemataceae bacterium]